MNNAKTNTVWDYLRGARPWWVLWCIGTFALTVYLLWDARAWLANAPGSSFRYTKLNTWPIQALWWLLAPPLIWLQVKLVPIDNRWAGALLRHVLMMVIVTVLFTVVEAWRAVVASHLPAAYLPVVIGDLRRESGWGHLPALIYLLLTAAVYAVGFYLQWRTSQRLTGELRVANARLETRLVRASLDALKMQLHPHFLFNTLNSITSLIRTGRTREAEDVVAGLGELLRRALENREETMDTLEREVQFLTHYLDIERVRFQDRLQVEYDIAPDCLLARVPSLMLQPLVENAMKHGISRDASARRLCVRARAEKSHLVLEIYNDGPPLPRDELLSGTGIGVQNTRARLHMVYGDEARFELRNQPPRGVLARITLPFSPAAP